MVLNLKFLRDIRENQVVCMIPQIFVLSDIARTSGDIRRLIVLLSKDSIGGNNLRPPVKVGLMNLR